MTITSSELKYVFTGAHGIILKLFISHWGPVE